MTLVRLRRRTAAWLALAAMALNAAWPLLANAQPPDPSVEICSANGGHHAPATPGKGLASHCNFCPFGAERGAAVSVSAVPPPLPVLAPARIPTLGDRAAPQLALYPTAPPRAPPVLS
ncbi:MAG TPA: DUF2946 family protein [Burkholderiales bacterium]|nr:DUF2946 family protein [Burkholderiales bacterium]